MSHASSGGEPGEVRHAETTASPPPTPPPSVWVSQHESRPAYVERHVRDEAGRLSPPASNVERPGEHWTDDTAAHQVISQPTPPRPQIDRPVSVPPRPYPAHASPPPPGSVFDTNLTTTASGRLDTDLVTVPLPPRQVTPATAPEAAFVAGVRTEIGQLEAYFKRQTQRFRLFGLTTLLAAAAVPVLVAAGAWSWLIALLGAAAAISGSIQTLYRFQDSALSAMSLANRLEAELVRYETGTAPYAPPVPGLHFHQFVDRVTTLREEAHASFHGVWNSAQAPKA